ncbi:hypothetical protein EKO27_g6592 [Xylaria grammica]|uniref:Carrier domain-containing protein n=1 Tax=Xylaria grammica TaxID=363999 RepID=A0A439D241_9PEZI|nr:hypothetical protein EKO27_g6592 [Xylaria grammica]
MAATNAEHVGLSEISRLSDEAKAACIQQSYPLVVECTPRKDSSRFRAGAVFNKTLILESEPHVLLRNLSRIILLLANQKHMDRPIAELLRNPSSIEDYQEMVAFNSRPATVPNICLHTLFEKSAQSYLQCLAVIAYNRQLTYRALDQACDCIAFFMVLAILSILKAGGCHVPLDPPHQRACLKNMIDQCKPSLILSSAAQRSRMVDLVDVPVLVVDSALLKQCGEQPNLAVSFKTRYAVGPQHLAYVIFTSGSTRPPKGVLMEHGSKASNVMHYANIFKLPHDEFGVFQFSSYTFDVSVVEIFATLAFGGTVCVPSEENRLDDVAGVMTSIRVEIAFPTPTTASNLEPSDVPGLKILCLSGGFSTTSILKTWSTSPNNGLFNAYGQTETAMHGATSRVLPGISSSNIGTPFGGQLWIVDPDNLSVLRPVGCIGEIVISGPPLARGYLGDPEETAKVFADNVSWFDGVSLQRLYKTGDMARYRGDGPIEFLGRKGGRQVKFHGFRIGLREIEAALHSVDRNGILTGAVVEKMPVMETDALMAFVQIKIQSIPDERALALIYDTFAFVAPVLVATFDLGEAQSRGSPLRNDNNSDGLAPKYAADHNTTRQAKATSAVSKASGDDYGNGTLPTDTQNMVASFWRKALRRGPEFVPRLDQDFFSTGGDPVSAISLVADFRRDGIHITVRDLYRLKSLSAMVEFVEPQRRPDATITQFASDIDEKRMITIPSMGQANSVASQPLLDEVANSLDISPDSIQDIYPCTLPQEGIMFLSERTKGSYHAFLSLLMPRRLDLDRPYKAFRTLVEMHDALRARYVFHKSLGSIQVVLTASAHFCDVDQRPPQAKQYLT